VPGNTKNDTVVLIPNFNGGEALFKTISSIESAESVDVLVVDDGSDVPPTEDDLSKAFKAYGNVKLFKLGRNQGIVAALNKGLEIAEQENYSYVARLDAGDRNQGLRFSKQRDFLEKNPHVALVGCWVEFINPDGDHLFVLKHPVHGEEIKKAIYRYNPFVHPATMFRLQAVQAVGGYPDDYPALEDWACFLELSKKWDLANLPEVLLQYEVSPRSISTTKRFRQSRSKVKLLWDNYNFSMNSTVGLIKNFLILVFPRGVLTHLKKYIYRRDPES
tara:strand:- start:6345 stop:7169 length:825 start_codon:yes stop_codon:yes gene_type:complete